MRLLVLGGTVFLGREIARSALRRGHRVVCAARGASGTVPDGAEHAAVDRSDPEGLEPLRGTEFDAVVDTAAQSLPWVRGALRTLTGTAHWTFVSSLSVYADRFSIGADAQTSPTLEPLWEDGPDPARDPVGADRVYGRVKAACEEEVFDRRDPAFVVRPGLIAGPGDVAGVFGYWPARMSRGGDVAVPDEDPLAPVPMPFQAVDVRDLADWIVLAAENRLDGAYDAVAPTRPLLGALHEVAEAVAPPGTRLVRVPQEVLAAHGVAPWEGDPSLPLWPPLGMYGALTRDVTDSIAEGLRLRPLAETARDALARDPGFTGRRPDAPVTGIAPDLERRLLEHAAPARTDHRPTETP